MTMTTRTKHIMLTTGIAVLSLGVGAALAGGSSSAETTGSTSTVTVTQPAPPAESTTVKATPPECRAALLKEADALGALLKSSKTYSSLILPAYKAGVYGTNVSPITEKVRAATAQVARSTRLINAGKKLAVTCIASEQ